MNYSGIAMIDEDTMYVAGGINKKLDKINNNFFLFKPISRSLEKLPGMHDIRYTFPLVHYRNMVIAVGGRVYGNDNVSLQRKCEYFDLQTKEWVKMPDMHIKRCTCLAFIYQESLWVVGGYTDYLKRSSVVEKYDFELKQWTKLDFVLYQGFEAGHIVSTAPDTVTIIGGKIYGGECNYVHQINLQEKTILNKKPMNYKRVLSKSAYSGRHFFVLGGNKLESPNAEYLDMDTGNWSMVDIEGMGLVSNWKTFG